MGDSKFRAVLTIYNTQHTEKVLEMRFDGLNDAKTHVDVKPNYDNRHKINDKAFMNALINLKSGYEHFLKGIMQKAIICKMLGLID